MPATALIQLTITQPAITERIRQAVEQSIQILERRINEIGTVEPLIQRQGVDRILVQVPGVDDPQRIIELLGQDRQADLPHGRSVDDRRAGAAGPRAAGSEVLYGTSRGGQPALSDREARHGVGRGPDRRAAGLRPAHQRADRHLQVQHQRRAPFRPGDAGKCRPAVRDRARQQGDLRAGDPRADPRRLGPDFRQLHRAAGERPRDAAARRRAAGAAHARSSSAWSAPASARIRSTRATRASYFGAVAGRPLHAR